MDVMYGSTQKNNMFSYIDGTWNHLKGRRHVQQQPPGVKYSEGCQLYKME